MLATLTTLQEDALQEITALDSLESLESWRISYLGSKGRLKGIMPLMKDVSKEDKPAVGKRLNEVKTALESAFDSRKADIAASSSPRPPLDITEPGVEAQHGRCPISVRQDLLRHRFCLQSQRFLGSECGQR